MLHLPQLTEAQGSRASDTTQIKEVKAEVQKYKEERDKIRNLAIKFRAERDEAKKEVGGPRRSKKWAPVEEKHELC